MNKNLRFLLLFLLGIGFLYLTFFGIGPVLMADGSMEERLITLAVVLILYAVLFVLFRLVAKKK